MSKLVKGLACALMIAGAIAVAPAPAAARSWHGGWHGGAIHGWHGGGFGIRHWGGIGLPGGWWGWHRHYRGWGPAYALSIPFFYAVPYYYAPESCGWVRVPTWRFHRRTHVRVWRCW
jgi:hypothetical protein